MKRDEMFGELRGLNREHMHMIWEVAKSGDLGSFGTLPTQLMHLDKNAYAVLPCAGPCVVDNRGAWCRRGIRETSNDPLLVLTRYSLSHSRTWVSSCPRQGSLGRSI